VYSSKPTVHYTLTHKHHGRD
jgi:hypothetical protein